MLPSDLSTGAGSGVSIPSALSDVRFPLDATQSSTVQRWTSSSLQGIRALILDLSDVFFEVIFPIFPLLHKPTFLRRISSEDYLHDRAFFAAVASMCALSSARVRDGATYSSRENIALLDGHRSEYFFSAADEALPMTAVLTQELAYMQACVLLSITSIQYGNSVKARYYLNLYHSSVAVGLLHDEDEWPSGLSGIETEERRILFWSTYTLDVFTSLIWKGAVRGSEVSFNVSYPSGYEFVDGVDSTDSVRTPDMGPSWLEGWNFVTDLYRLLERMLQHLRPKPQRTPALCFGINDGWHMEASLLDSVTAMYDKLPTIFKSTRFPTNESFKDLYSFQAANIAATVQLVRMVLFTIKGSSTKEKCEVASEVIMVFANIPGAYLRAISSPLLHHLTGIGMLLGTMFHEKLSESDYSRARSVLLEFATLITNLEAGLHYTAGTSQKLRAQVTALDKYWTDQRQHQPAPPHRTQDVPCLSADQLFADAEYSLYPDTCAQDSLISFPPQLLDDWSSIFDFAQV